jgi:S-adenosylmethionine-diacylglycerol 3-amino-3-carboxypropyl transferase
MAHIIQKWRGDAVPPPEPDDTDLSVVALNVHPDDRILVAASSATAFSLLADGAEVVVTALRPEQIYLFELQRLAVLHLTLEDCRRFLGARKASGRIWTYRTLRHRLSPEARAYWDAQPRRVEDGILLNGWPDRAAKRLAPFFLRWVHRPGRLRELFRQTGLPDQDRFYRETWHNSRWRKIVRVLSYLIPSLSEPRIRRFFTDVPARNNYFLSLRLWGRFLPGEKGLPPYLRREVFHRVRAGMERLRWSASGPADFLSVAPDDSFTKLAILDAFERLPEGKRREAFRSAARTLTPGGLMLLRSTTDRPVPPEELFREMIELGETLTTQDRSFAAGRLFIFERT